MFCTVTTFFIDTFFATTRHQFGVCAFLLTLGMGCHLDTPTRDEASPPTRLTVTAVEDAPQTFQFASHTMFSANVVWGDGNTPLNVTQNGAIELSPGMMHVLLRDDAFIHIKWPETTTRYKMSWSLDSSCAQVAFGHFSPPSLQVLGAPGHIVRIFGDIDADPTAHQCEEQEAIACVSWTPEDFISSVWSSQTPIYIDVYDDERRHIERCLMTAHPVLTLKFTDPYDRQK